MRFPPCMKRIIFIRRSFTAAAFAVLASALVVLPAAAQQGESSRSGGGETSSGETRGGESRGGSSTGSMSNREGTSNQEGRESREGMRGESNAPFSQKDRSFLSEAAQGGLMEVRMGELGEQKATNPEVKNLAQTLHNDHQKANDELAGAVQSKGIQLPTEMSSTHQAAISSLESKSGAEFDRQFVRDTIRDHRKDIDAFERASRDLSDPDLKSWAEKTLPVLRKHLSLAEQAEKSLSSGSERSGRSERGESRER